MEKSAVDRRLSATAAIAVLAIAGLCLLILLQSPGHPSASVPLRNVTSADVSSQLGTLADKIRTAEKDVSDARKLVAEFGAQRAKAEQADTALSQESSQRTTEVPTLEAALAACERSEKKALQSHREAAERFSDFRRDKDPVSDYQETLVKLATLVRSSKRLTPRQEWAWEDISKSTRAGLLKYLAVRERLADEERSLATEAARLTKERQSLSSRLAFARRRQAEVPSELNRNRASLPGLEAASAKAAAGLASAQERLTALTRERQSLNRQLAAIQAATPKPVAQRSPQASSPPVRSTNNSSTGYVYIPRAPQAGGGLGALPKPVRSLILADVAGLDTDLDLGLDDPPIVPRPRIYIHGADAQPDSNAGGSYVHRDGMGRTVKQGNQTLVQRLNGPSAVYTRQGDWEAVQWDTGVYGYRYYDDSRGVQRFDYRNPMMGIRTIGERPYIGNDYGQGWSQQLRGW
jgi:septal ring factor EnvC (AmiA/AmiB activator)